MQAFCGMRVENLLKEPVNIKKKSCSRLYQREKKKYFNNLNLNKITDNAVFWKTVKLLLLDKGINTAKISLINYNKMITEDTEVANTLNMYFEIVVNSIAITENKHLLTETDNLEDPMEKSKILKIISVLC